MWVDTFSALLVPLIAILGVYIAYQQYRVNRQRLNHETYERRLAVFKSIQRHLAEVVRKNSISHEEVSKFYGEASEAAFLFDGTVKEKVDKIYENSTNLANLRDRLYPMEADEGLPPCEERNRISAECTELVNWHLKEFNDLENFFAKKLGFSFT